MSPYSGEAWIDDELRNVAVPGIVIQKLHAIASLDDTELDRALCDVAPTAELLERLRSIGSLDENDINDELRHVELPVSLAERLRRIPQAIQQRVRPDVLVRRLAIAASLLVAVGVGYLAALAPSYFGKQQKQTAGANPDAGTPSGKKGRDPTSRPANAPAVAAAAKNDLDLVKNGSRGRAADSVLPPESTTVPGDNANSGQLVENRQNNPAVLDDPSAADQPVTVDNVLGANVVADRLPPLESLPPPVWRGVIPPREFLGFQLRYGVHPLVSPAASEALAICPVPLVTSTESFQEALQLTAQRKLPPPHKIRAEEFLAAMDYGFSPPESAAVGIRTALGPSPWGTPALSLLQVAAQAKALSRDAERASHLVVVLDNSATMRWERRWHVVLSGLKDYVQRMQPNDRVTLILMGDQAEMVAERLAPKEAAAAVVALPAQPSAKIVNAVDALSLARDVAGRGLSDGPGRIVILTDGALDLGESAFERIEKVFRSSDGSGFRFDVFDVRQEETIDGELNHLAEIAAASGVGSDSVGSGSVGSGSVTHLATADDVRWRLLELSAGASQLVAAKATMKVRFKPDAVAMYRLIGHEATSIATSVAGLTSVTVEADLRSGEVATGLFEVFLKPDGGETVATVEVTWRDPKTGAVQKTEQTVSRLQIAPSFYQAPLSLQMAALAAETAEILRNSFFAPPNSHSLANVAELGAVLNSRLRSRPSYARLMTLVEQAERSHVTQ